MEALKIGFVITFLGMTSVFVFLTIMVLVMNIVAKIMQFLSKYYPETELSKNNIQKQNDIREIALAIACAARKRTEEL